MSAILAVGGTAHAADPAAIYESPFNEITRAQSDFLSPADEGWPEPWSIDGETPYIQRFGIGHRVGDGPGFDDNYSNVEWMIPIRGDVDWDNMFSELRFLARNDGLVGANAGLGYRRYDLGTNRIYGLNVFYDYRQTEANRMQQMGLGLETLGPIFDFHLNFYLPEAFEVRGPLPNIFVGHEMIINRAEVGMTGGDAEMGVNLPELFNVRSRLVGGLYHYDGHGNGDATGWRARVEADYGRVVWVDASFQDDDMFGQTASVGVEIRYAHRFLPPYRQSVRPMDHMFFRREGDWASRNISHRLSDPVSRQQFMLLTMDEGVVATDSMGTPLNFLHVANGFAGTGTFEDPYGTLSAALADGDAPMSIIYTPFGGAYVEDVTLVAGATVLSNGPVQTVETQFGTQQLPFSGTSTDLSALPTITGNVTMADDSRFSGFDVTGALTATGVMDITIDNTVVTNAAGDAVTLSMVDGATVDNLILSSGAGRGLLIDDSDAELMDITVTSATDDGVEINAGATNRTVEITNLVVEAAGAQGLDINVDGAGDQTLVLDGINSLTSTGNAFDAALGAASTGDMILMISNTTTASTAGAGFNFDGTAGAGTLFISTFSVNAVTTAATGGLLADTVTFDVNPTQMGIQQVFAGNFTVGDLSDTTMVTGDGVRLIDPSGTLAFSVLNIANDTGTGLLVDTKGGGTTFLMNTMGGSIITTNGPAMNLDPLTINFVLDTVRSDDSPTWGAFYDTVSGNMSIETSIFNGSVMPSIVIQNTPAPFIAAFGDTSINSTISGVQADNVITTANGMNLTLFFNSLTIVGP